MRGGDLHHPDGPERKIDLDLGHMRAEPVDGVGVTLAVRVERAGGRIEGRLGGKQIAARIGRKRRKLDRAHRLALGDPDAARRKVDGSRGTRIGKPQDLGAQAPARELRRLSGDEGLPRGGGLAAIRADVGVGRDEIERGQRGADRIGDDLRDDRVRALADIDRALVQRQAAVRLHADENGRGIGERGIAASVPHARNPDPAAAAGGGGRVEFRGGGAGARPMRPQRLQAGADADACAEHLAGHGRLVGGERVVDAEREPIDLQPVREFVIELLDRDARLRNAEAAERPRRHEVGVHRARARPIIRHEIGPRRMHGHAVRDGRPPRRVCSGIEVGGEIERHDLAVAGRARARRDARRMALGRRHHRFRPAVDHADRATQMPGGDGNEGLDREIELGAETAADRGRHDAHRFRRDAEDRCDIVAVHVGGLRAGGDFDPVADADGAARLRLDRGVFDKAGVERALGDHVGVRQGAFHIAAHDPPARKHIAGAVGVQERGIGGERSLDRLERRPLVPAYGKRGEVERGHRLGLPDHERDRLALEARFLRRENRLVGAGRNHAERVPARHVGCGEDTHDAGMLRRPCRDIAKPESGAVEGRTDRPRNERVRGMAVRAEQVGAVDLAHAVEAGNAGADCPAGNGRDNRARRVGGIQDGVDDLAIPGAAAEHAADRVQHVAFDGIRMRVEQRRGGDQHSRRADAALGGAMREERFLQPPAADRR